MPSKTVSKKTTDTPVETKPTKTATTTTTTTTPATTTQTVSASKARAKKQVEPEKTVEKTVEVTPETQNVIVSNETNEPSISDDFSEFITKFQGMITQFNSLKTELKVLERKTVKQLKVVQKINNKKRKKGTRAPSGFVKPSLISDE